MFWKPQRKLSSPLYPQGASQGGCSIIAIKLSREKEFGQRCFSCQLLWVGACAPTHSWMCASLLNQPLLLSPWSLLRVTNHRRTGFQTRVGLPATSSSEASSRFFLPSSTSQMVLQAFTSDECRLRTLFINHFAQPRAYSKETELDQQPVWGEPESFLGMRSIL